MKRTLTLVAATLFVLGLMAGPAAAHILVVQDGDVDTHRSAQHDMLGPWVGGGPLPAEAQGEGLIPGGPTGDWILPPAHDTGLVDACESTDSNSSAVDIIGPGPTPCIHG